MPGHPVKPPPLLVNLPSPTGAWYGLLDRPGNALLSAVDRPVPAAGETVFEGPAGRLVAVRGPVGIDPRAGELRRGGRRLAGTGDRLAGEPVPRPDWLRRAGRRRRRLPAVVRLAHAGRVGLLALARDVLPRLACLEAADPAAAGIHPRLALLFSLGAGAGDVVQDMLSAGVFLPRAVMVQWADEIVTADETVVLPVPARTPAAEAALAPLRHRLEAAFPGRDAGARPLLLVDRGLRRIALGPADARALEAAGIAVLDAGAMPLRRLLPAIRGTPLLMGHDGLAAAAAVLRGRPVPAVDLAPPDGDGRPFPIAPAARDAVAGRDRAAGGQETRAP